MNRLRRWRILAVASAVLFTLLAPPPATATAANAALDTLRARIIYFVRANRPTDRDLALAELSARSPLEGSLWKQFVTDWDTANRAQQLNFSPPAGLPTSGHIFVVLGASLTSSGAIKTQLTNRLKVTLAALTAYPNSKVLVSGGAPKSGYTEAARMREWLLANGITDDRILTEAKSSSTVGNANYSMAILKSKPEFTSYTLISDASHIRRASMLFRAAEVKLEVAANAAWPMTQLGNVAYKDKTITNPPNDQTMKVIASNVASVWGISSTYSGVIADPPTTAVLTGLSAKPKKTTFPVGSTFTRSDLTATATYDGFSVPVTSAVSITGFNASKVGKPTVTVSYTHDAVTKTATFSVSVVKAASAVTVKASTTTPKRKKTTVQLTIQVSTPTGVVPTGSVAITSGKSVVKTLSLDRDDKGKVRVKLPKFTKTGKKTLTISYRGSSTVNSSNAKVKVTVKR